MTEADGRIYRTTRPVRGRADQVMPSLSAIAEFGAALLVVGVMLVGWRGTGWRQRKTLERQCGRVRRDLLNAVRVVDLQAGQGLVEARSWPENFHA